MNATIALFKKQLADLPKNISVTMMFVIFPLLALFMGNLFESVAAIGMQVNFAMMMASMGPMILVANTIAEDNEYKSLRFLIMAGVKPGQYLAGLIIFAVVVSAIPMLAFAFMMNLTGQNLLVFLAFGVGACLSSSILGAVVGLFSKNVQQCSAIYTPLMMVLAFIPFIASMNPNMEPIARFVFTGQTFNAMFDLAIGSYIDGLYYVPYYLTEWTPFTDLTFALAVIGGSGLFFAVLFAIAYSRKGLKG